MWKLSFDDKKATYTIQAPSADDIAEHVEALNNQERTFVNLEDDTGQIAVSGGKTGKVMVHCTPDFENGFLIADAGIRWDEGVVEMSVQGQRAEYSARYFVAKGSAVRATLYFFHNHTPDPDFVWENDQDAQLGA